MNQSIDIAIKQKLPKEKTIKSLPTGSVIQFEDGDIGLVCWRFIVIINDYNKEACFNVHSKDDFTEYVKHLGTLAGITVQED